MPRAQKFHTSSIDVDHITTIIWLGIKDMSMSL